MFDQFEKMEKINLLEGEDDLGSDSCPCSCHPAPGNLLTANIFESGPMPTPWKFLESLKVIPSCYLGQN